jgi:hypothetical protein
MRSPVEILSALAESIRFAAMKLLKDGASTASVTVGGIAK